MSKALQTPLLLPHDQTYQQVLPQLLFLNCLKLRKKMRGVITRMCPD